MIAQEFALRFPERVRALTLLSTTPGGPKAIRFDEMLDETDALMNAIRAAAASLAETRAMLWTSFTPAYLDAPGHPHTSTRLARVCAPLHSRQLIGQATWRACADGRQQFAARYLHALANDRGDAHRCERHGCDHRLAQFPLMAPHIEGAQLHVLSGLRHGPAMERPDLVNSLLLAFLAHRRAS